MYIDTITTAHVSVIKEHSQNALSLIKWGENFKGNLEDVKNRINLLVKAGYLPEVVEDFITYTATHDDITSIQPALDDWVHNQNIAKGQVIDRQLRKIKRLEKRIDGYKSEIMEIKNKAWEEGKDHSKAVTEADFDDKVDDAEDF